MSEQDQAPNLNGGLSYDQMLQQTYDYYYVGQGMTFKQIAAILGKPTYVIRDALIRRGIHKPEHGNMGKRGGIRSGQQAAKAVPAQKPERTWSSWKEFEEFIGNLSKYGEVKVSNIRIEAEYIVR